MRTGLSLHTRADYNYASFEIRTRQQIVMNIL